MKRRTFLASTAGVGLAALTAGCQSTVNADLKISMLMGSVPGQLIKLFQTQQKELGTLAVAPQDSLLQLYEQLQTWHSRSQSTSAPNPLALPTWVTLGDYWLASAIGQGLIQPIDPAALENWATLPPAWPELVRRDKQGRQAKTGSIWGVPYRWSSLALLYNADKIPSTESTLTTWADLLRPDLTQRIILPDHPRLVIGLGLKAVGASANVEDPAAVEGLAAFLKDLQGQVRSYDSSYYLESIIEGEALAVVGWSDEILTVARQYRNLRAVFPDQGTLLSADLWVQPTSAPKLSPLAKAWIDFCLSPDFATQMAIYNQGTSPQLWQVDPKTLSAPLNQTMAQGLSPQGQANSEFLYPLDETVQARYDDLWQELRGKG